MTAAPAQRSAWTSEGRGGELVKFYIRDNAFRSEGVRAIICGAQNDEGPWGRIQGPSKAIFAGPARCREPF